MITLDSIAMSIKFLHTPSISPTKISSIFELIESDAVNVLDLRLSGSEKVSGFPVRPVQKGRR